MYALVCPSILTQNLIFIDANKVFIVALLEEWSIIKIVRVIPNEPTSHALVLHKEVSTCSLRQ